jgi:hypothetical protein
MKKENTFINGEIVSSAEIRKSWKSIVDTVNHTKKPTYVLSVLLRSLKIKRALSELRIS